MDAAHDYLSFYAFEISFDLLLNLQGLGGDVLRAAEYIALGTAFSGQLVQLDHSSERN
jgi:hypothetical protein